MDTTNVIEVMLEKPHTHAGKPYQKGQKIIVSESDARFLLNNKVIKSIPAAARAKAQKTGE